MLIGDIKKNKNNEHLFAFLIVSKCENARVKDSTLQAIVSIGKYSQILHSTKCTMYQVPCSTLETYGKSYHRGNTMHIKMKKLFRHAAVDL